MQIKIDGKAVKSNRELEEVISSIFKGMRRGGVKESPAGKAYKKLGIQGFFEMLKPIIKADLTVDEAENAFDILKILIRRAKVKSALQVVIKKKKTSRGGEE